MWRVDVLLEIVSRGLDRTFSYFYCGKKSLDIYFRVLVDFNGRSLMGFVLKKKEISKEEIGDLKEIKEENIVDEEPLLSPSLFQLAEVVANYYLASRARVLQSMLPRSLSPRRSSLKGVKIAYETYVKLLDDSEKDLSPKQLECVRLLKENNYEIRKKEAGSPSILKALSSKGVISFFRVEKKRGLHRIKAFPHEKLELTPAQKEAFFGILKAKQDVTLLEGVTGSGKTEIYLQLSEKALEEGKSVIMLVPEINLTPQMVSYFAARFHEKVAILHSGLTEGERYDEYRRIAKGEAQIVIGARSAVFAPLKNVGLIILDEEHVESYKQETAPFYHAREVAIMRGKIEGARVLLGSATPSLESRARAHKGVYAFVELKERVNGKALPKVRILDLRTPDIFTKASDKISRPLLYALKERLEKGEQSLLLLNRRGYWTGIECPDCGHLFMCPDCGGYLTYHMSDQLLKCHHCGYVEEYPECCPQCHNTKLRRIGYGTERLERDLRDLLPEARIARLDRDVGRVSKKMEEILEDFRAGKYDILLGTQMIAKGHDFPNLTLAGMALADIGLALPSYRSSERTFNLVTQTVGRAGRSEKNGEAFIQTFNPEHYAIVLGARQDYEAFFRYEMKMRHDNEEPPYVYMLTLYVSAKSEERSFQGASDLRAMIEELKLNDLRIIGPFTPYISVSQGLYRKVLLLKARDMSRLKPKLKEIIETYGQRGGLKTEVNVDPLDY